MLPIILPHKMLTQKNCLKHKTQVNANSGSSGPVDLLFTLAFLQENHCIHRSLSRY